MNKIKITITVICLNVLWTGSSAFPTGEKVSMPVIHLTFEQDIVKNIKIIKNSSGKNYPGTFVNVGKNTKRVQGKQGFAVRFGGSNKKRKKSGGMIIRKTGIDFSKAFTATMWVKFDKDIKLNGFNDILGNAVSDRGPGFRLTVFYGSLVFRSGDGKKVWGCSSNRSKVALACDIWLHLAVVFDGEKGSIFLDGEKVAEQDMTITSGRKDIFVGSYRGGFAYSMKGAIDELKIYNYAKTDLEISAKYLGEIN